MTPENLRPPIEARIITPQGENKEIDPTLKTAVVFAGQARKLEELKNQGLGLLENTTGRRFFGETDEILSGSFPGRFKEGISGIIRNGSMEDFENNLQLLILLNDAGCQRVLEEREGSELNKFRNIINSAGQSLGELNALRFAGAFDLETLCKLGVGRHDAMRDAPGTLAGFNAGSQDSRIADIIKDFGLEVSIETNSNFVVLGGEVKAVNEAVSNASDRKLRAIPLNTPGAFHTSLMHESRNRMKSVVENLDINDTKIGVVANTTGKEIRKKEDIKKEFVNQMTERVKWKESIDLMTNNGAQQIVEIGSETVTKQIERDMKGKRNLMRKALVAAGGIAALTVGTALVIQHLRED